MIKFDEQYFSKFTFSIQQTKKNFDNALKDLRIAKEDKILDVKFNYTYTALIKGAIALVSFYNVKVRSVPGHHIKIIEKLAEILDDNLVSDMGNVMRSKRNTDFYSGGIEVTEKECREYIEFTDKVLNKIKTLIFQSI